MAQWPSPAEGTSLNLDFIKADDLSTVWSETIQATPDTFFIDGKTQIANKLASSLNIQLGAKTSEEIGIETSRHSLHPWKGTSG